MPKEIDTQAQAASEAGVVRPYNLAFLDMEGSAVRVASTPFNIEHLGEIYKGVGELGEVSKVEESGEARSFQISLTLNGVDPSLVQQALAENYQNRECTVWAGFLDEDNQKKGEPVIIFSGLMQNMPVTAGKVAKITVEAVSEIVLWESASGQRYNNQAQQARFPGDLGLEFMEQMKEKQILWPDRQ